MANHCSVTAAKRDQPNMLVVFTYIFRRVIGGGSAPWIAESQNLCGRSHTEVKYFLRDMDKRGIAGKIIRSAFR